MTYEQTLEYLFSQLPAYYRIGKAAYKGNLDNTVALDNYFGNPHTRFLSVHIAGTNGKGSVSHMIASVLQEAGYRTGLYTSPHLRDFRERIRIDGEMIPEDSVIDFVHEHRKILETLKPSFFEMTVAMAFDYFVREKVDVAVVEVGLGGRLDSTNIITPILSVITNIGHDHMDILGDTLQKVASEKAGIIKKGVPVVISESQPAITEVFIGAAEKSGSPVFLADERYSCLFTDDGISTSERQYEVVDRLSHTKYTGTTVLGGDYQSKNIPAVFCALFSIQHKFRITERNFVDGIRNVILNTGLAGRWQVLGTEPLIICDTAHNREGLELVMRQLSRIDRSALHMIIGFVNDKDLNSVLPLFPADAKYYFTRASVPRALDEETLKARARQFGLSGDSFKDVKSAVEHARKLAGKTDLIFIGGSTFVVAEVI